MFFKDLGQGEARSAPDMACTVSLHCQLLRELQLRPSWWRLNDKSSHLDLVARVTSFDASQPLLIPADVESHYLKPPPEVTMH